MFRIRLKTGFVACFVMRIYACRAGAIVEQVTTRHFGRRVQIENFRIKKITSYSPVFAYYLYGLASL